jgi:hypothetical protein
VIKFEFTVSDEDAENIFSCIQSHIVDIKSKMLDERASDHVVNADWMKRVDWMEKHVVYLQGLMPKMLNTRVDECNHLWVCADNKYVTNAEMCLHCLEVRAKIG